jgi:hypothetical protein
MASEDVRTVLNRGRPVMVRTDSRDEDHVPFVGVVLLNGHGDRVVDEFTADELREVADAMDELQSAAIIADEAAS